ncbi:hypothetical protein FRC07_011890 [Ceratobasidium sp. 392]|nr:hypothetical protein FRC07_011890 [Ceratobasidium sp. 392]
MRANNREVVDVALREVLEEDAGGGEGKDEEDLCGRTLRQRGRDQLTVIVSVPLDHIRDFTSQVGSMGNALLALSPPITGLDRTIVISPARLHLTLGVMALDDSPAPAPVVSSSTGDVSEPPPRKTVTDAVNLLHQLKPNIIQMLNNQPIQLTLDELTVMRRSQTGEADVLYLGPSNSLAKTEEHTRSVGLLHMVHEKFREANFITETRPLKLHCTVVNTSHRRTGNRGGPRGVPFSMSEIENAIAQDPAITGTLLSSPPTLAIRELKICRMGSFDELGKYVRVGGIEW